GAGPGPRPRGRVRLAPGDHGEARAAPRAADGWPHALRGAGPPDARAREPAPLPALRAGRLPGPLRVAQSADARRLDHRRAARHQRAAAVGGSAEAHPASARAGRAPGALRRSLPPRVLGRPAPADRDRTGALALAEARRARRAGLGARRVDPRPDPESPA